MRIRVALAASNHVAALSIYLSSRNRKGIHLKFIAAFAEKIYTKGKGEGHRGGELPFSRNASFRGVSRRYAWYKFKRHGGHSVCRSTDEFMSNVGHECAVKRNGNEAVSSVIFFMLSHEPCVTFQRATALTDALILIV